MWKVEEAGDRLHEINKKHVSVGQNCVESTGDLKVADRETVGFRRTELCGKTYSIPIDVTVPSYVSVGQNCVERKSHTPHPMMQLSPSFRRTELCGKVGGFRSQRKNNFPVSVGQNCVERLFC